jgi:hypothetical protein
MLVVEIQKLLLELLQYILIATMISESQTDVVHQLNPLTTQIYPETMPSFVLRTSYFN